MAHMIPQYELTSKWELTKPNGDSEQFDSIYDVSDFIEHDALEAGNGETYTIEAQVGWFARLSAPGYLDCTGWTGPFPSEVKAREFIRETYEVDPTTGDELDEDEDEEELEEEHVV